MSETKGRKKVCFVNTTQFFGGGEKWHYEMAREMKDYFEVSFICSNPSEIAEMVNDLDIPVEHLSISNISFLNPISRFFLKRSLKKLQPDIIIINSSAELKIIAPIANKLGIKSIYRRGSAVPIRATSYNRRLFKTLDLVIANSSATKKTILEKDNALYPDEKIEVLYNPVNTDEFRPAKKNETEQIVLGNAGRLVQQKNQRALIALSHDLENRKIPHKILIAGKGDMDDHLKTEIEKSDAKNIFLMGHLKSMREFYNSLDLFVMTSAWEGFGYVAAEAMSCEVPVVAFNVSNLAEIVDHGKTGYLVNFNNVHNLADKIESLYKNKDIIERMGKKARETVIDRFSFPTQAQKLRELLERV